AIGLKQLDKLPARTAARRRNAARLTERLASVPSVIAPRPTAEAEHVYHQYTIRLDLNRLTCDRDHFAKALQAEGIGVGVHYPKAAIDQPVFAERMESLPDLLVCRALAREVICLPVHHDLSDLEVDRVAEAVAKVAAAFANRRRRARDVSGGDHVSDQSAA